MGMIIVIVYALIAVFAWVVAPYSPIEQHVKDRLQPPWSENYVLGTDEFGRDILSRLMHGATNSLRVAVTAVVVAGAIGTITGTVSAYVGGITDMVLMRGMDLIFAFPAILLALFVSAALGPRTLQYRDRHLDCLSADLRPCSARLGVIYQGNGFCRSVALFGRDSVAIDTRPHFAQRARAFYRASESGFVVGDVDRSQFKFFGSRHRAARAVVGIDAQ